MFKLSASAILAILLTIGALAMHDGLVVESAQACLPFTTCNCTENYDGINCGYITGNGCLCAYCNCTDFGVYICR